MKIQKINNYNHTFQNSRISKEQKENRQKQVQQNALDISSCYNIGFCGLFKKQEEINAQYVFEPIQMEPNKKYHVAKDSCFELGAERYFVDLSSPLCSNIMNFLDKKNEITLGRDETVLAGMDNTVSRKHLKLSKNKKGAIIAEDLNSTNGTKILPNVITPDLTKGMFPLQKGKKYLFPLHSVIAAEKTPIFLYDYKDKFEKMADGDYLLVGRNKDSDIQINSSFVSGQHLLLEKYKDKVIVTDLNSTNGSSFIGIEYDKAAYKEDYSNISHKTALKKGTPTLLPKNSQLYLGENFTIDIRNQNIIDTLNKKGEATIGRSADCDLVVPDFYDQVSRKHLLLEKKGSNIIATDLNSMNETLVIPQNEIEAFYGGVYDINISQGNIGDCYLLSTIYALSRNKTGQKLLKEMVKVDNNGNYIVKFYDNDPITVKPEELDGQKLKNGKEKRSVSGDLGIKAIERAYAKMIKIPRSAPTMFQEIDNGGYMDTALEQMTGIKSFYYLSVDNNISRIFDRIVEKGIQNHILTCATSTKGNYNGYADPQQRFIERHAYSIKYIDRDKQRISIVNPHNTKRTYDISWQEYNKYFSTLYVAYT